MRTNKRVVRYSLLSANLALLGLVIFFVVKSPADSQAVRQNAVTPTAPAESVVGPLDVLSSADIAVHVSRVAGLPESVDVTNNADSIALAEASSSADTSVVAKPQLVANALISYKDIQEYTTVAGDTVSAIASRFGVSSDSVRWSNGLTGESVRAGRVLYLPPAGTNGVVHTVTSGDTPQSLAARFSADVDLIISVNDAEITGLRVGQRALIPGGTVQATAPRGTSYSSFAWGAGAVYGRNGYVRGYCTYYAASRVAVPANWGNARTWASGARATPGWIVSSIPRVGAVAQTTRMHPLGHVAVVEDVSADGTLIKYSDMNGLAGFGRVGYSDWVSANTYENYIYRP